ncbi:MAG: YggS family pyridoxal phosphate-dependent enzyme [Gemmatimonadales bacterium]
MSDSGLAARLTDIRSEILRRQRVGGVTHPVRVVAVTKGHGADAVRAAVAAGLNLVGENRVQEALSKQAECADIPVQWHLIGTLQRNKVRGIMGRFALIHSVDRIDVALELDRRSGPGAVQRILVQVNCSGETQKGGVEPDKLAALLDSLRALQRLDVRGLMTMAAFTDDERDQRRAFGRLRSLRDELQDQGHALPELSMGMSGDYGVAVEEGATLVRLGTILFGARD